MAQWENDSGEVSIKIAIIGQPGSGKGSILRQLAIFHDQAAVRTGIISEAEIVRTEFIWPEPIASGEFVRVKVYALSGKPEHQAAEQLLIQDCDALVFVVDCDPVYIAGSRDCLLALMTNASHVGLNWEETVIVMQYNRAERYAQLKPGELDAWLGIEDGKVARYITSSNSGENLAVAVNDAIHKVIVRLTEKIQKIADQ